MRVPDNGNSDDADWVGWNTINERLDIQELRQQFPRSDSSAARLFASLRWRELTARYLRRWASAPATAPRRNFAFQRR
jgi:hypothetical protein